MSTRGPTNRYPTDPYSEAQGLEQPHIPEQEDDGSEEGQPDLPADASALSHAEHAIHCAAQTRTGAIERVVHLLGECGRIADFVSDGQCDLHEPEHQLPAATYKECIYHVVPRARAHEDLGSTHVLQHLDLGTHSIQLFLILALQLAQDGVAVLAARIGRGAPVTALTRGVGAARVGGEGGPCVGSTRKAIASA